MVRTFNISKLHRPHEAGYDAFMCGYVFIRVAHIWTCRNVKSVESRPMFFHEYLTALKLFRNSVNVIRASVDHVKMDGSDPETARPQWLFVQTRQGKQNLASLKLSGLFSPYGSVDIRMLTGQCQAVIAVSNHRCAKDLLKAFRRHPVIRVSRYSTWKHSPVVRGLLWMGVVVSGSVCVVTLYLAMQDTTNIT
ncbi:Poly(A)-specific ribonuclease PNLDC1 [Lamellibrachia satsuma]|nr:Poly(A)-specific ribonuclease PNLDC1 [Lamellibrachia satsuma]